MNKPMLERIREATRLTSLGRLREATDGVQRTLQGLIRGGAASANVYPRGNGPVDPSSRLKLADTAGSTPRPDLGRAGEAPDTEQSRPISEQAGDGIPGGQFLAGSFTNPAGARNYKLFIPSAYQGQALPLVVMLHGCTQTPDDFAAGTRMNLVAKEQQYFVLYPAQSRASNTSTCWNWFKSGDQSRDRGEPSIIAGMTREIVSSYHLDARRIYVAGLSAGGAMAAIMGMTYPDLYAAIGVHSGLPYAVAHDLPSALAAMRGPTLVHPRHRKSAEAESASRFVPIIVFHGDRDTTVHPCNSDQVISQWSSDRSTHPLGPDAERSSAQVVVDQGQVPNGHSYTRTIHHNSSGRAVMEQWLVRGAGHAWSGGSPNGSFTDSKGPDATRAMIRFFSNHSSRDGGEL